MTKPRFLDDLPFETVNKKRILDMWARDINKKRILDMWARDKMVI